MASLQEDLEKILAQPATSLGSIGDAPPTQLSSELAVTLGLPDPRKPREKSVLDSTTLFLKSTLQSAVFDPFGVDPSREVNRFRVEHPALDIVSSVVGSIPFFAAPFLLPAKVLSAIPLAGRLASAGGRLTAAGRPAAGRALGDFARFLPFEAGRVAIGTGIGATEGKALEKLEETASLAAFDLVSIPLTTAAMTKLFRSFPAARGSDAATTRLQKTFALDTGQVLQKQLADVRRLKANPGVEATPEIEAQFEAAVSELSTAIRAETAVGTRGFTFVGRLANQKGQPTGLNTLFREDLNSVRKTFQVQMPIKTAGPHGFDTFAARDAALKHFPEGFEQNVQFPRIITATEESGIKTIENTLTKNMRRYGDVWYEREVGDGGYVMARKVGDKLYTLFKTDAPTLYAPPKFAVAKRHGLQNAFAPVEEKVLAGIRARTPLAKEVNSFNKWASDIAIVGSPRDGRGALLKAGNAALKALPEETRNAINAVGKELGAVGESSGRFLKAHLAPAIAQFSRNPRALRAVQMAGNAFRFSNKTAMEMLHGSARVAGGENPFAALMIPNRVLRRGEKGLIGTVRGFNERQMQDVTRVLNEAMSPEQALAEGIDGGVMKLLNDLDALDEVFIGSAQNLAQLGGTLPIAARRSHYMISRAWVGDWRLALKKPDGTLVNMAGARDRRGVLEMAERMQKAAKAEGQVLEFDRNAIFRIDKFGDDITTLSYIDVEDPIFRATQEARGTVRKGRAAGRPGFLKPRTGVGGFIGDLEPMTQKELTDQLTRQITGRQKFLADLTIASDPILQRELGLLGVESPDLYNQVLGRINDMKGVPGVVVQALESILDAPLAPIFGKGAARKITRTLNSLEFNLTLGMGDVGFPLINALTFMQTQLSEAAFVLKGSTADLLKYYVFQPTRGANGLPKGSVGVLDMSKMFRQSMRELVKMGDDPVLSADMAWAIDIGEVAPKFVEEFGGATSRKALSFQRLLKGEESFSNFMLAASQIMPTLSEEFARGQSFVLGRMIARDFMGLKGRNLREFARQFTQRTMFGYGTADRPRWMAGAVGGTLGLFKNWSSHYIANMALYGGQAATRRNWAPMLWMMAGTGTVAGAGGLPGIGMVDNANRFFNDKSLMESTYEAFGMRDSTAIADGVWYGLPGLFGTALQGRAGAPGADIARDAGFMFSAAIANRGVNAVNAFGSAFDQWDATGENPLKTQRVRTQFARAFGPRTLYRAMQGSERKAIVSAQSGNKLLGDVSFPEKLAFTVGISPLKIDKAFEAHRELWEQQEKMNDTVKSLGTALADAEGKRDWRLVDRIWFESGLLGITDRVIRSAKRREANQNQDLFQRQFKGFQADARLRLFGVR